jgi:hypothetical protein
MKLTTKTLNLEKNTIHIPLRSNNKFMQELEAELFLEEVNDE